MPRVIGDKAQEMLDMLAPFLSSDPLVQSVFCAIGNEIERIETTARAITNAMFPAQAEDLPILAGKYVASLLSMWETLLDLPVAPADVSLADRQSKVLAHIRKRNSGAGSDWVAILNTAVGSLTWSYSEITNLYRVLLTIPFEGSYSAAQVQRLAAAISPAHIEIVTEYAQGFIIGTSLIGDQI